MSASHPACFRNATTGSPVRPDFSATTYTMGMPWRFFSLCAGSVCKRYGCAFDPAGCVTSRVVSCATSVTGGSYTSGTAVTPHGVAAPNGAPPPSTLTIAFTRLGRSLATRYPKGPPAECTWMIDGPILSSSSAPRLAQSRCARTLSCGAAFCPASI